MKLQLHLLVPFALVLPELQTSTILDGNILFFECKH